MKDEVFCIFLDCQVAFRMALAFSYREENPKYEIRTTSNTARNRVVISSGGRAHQLPISLLNMALQNGILPRII
jgi:hypothetical protein